MFNSITGQITFKGAQNIYLANGGFEWDIGVSVVTLRELPEVGEETRIFTYLHHKEDMMKVYGFASELERDLFLDLCKITGIGPRQAIKILSGIAPRQFLAALDAEDVDGLSRVPGLGKKTASKIILSMRGKLSKNTEAPGLYHDLIEALSDMGFDRGKVQETVKKLVREMDTAASGTDGATEGRNAEETEKELFRKAIVLLSNK